MLQLIATYWKEASIVLSGVFAILGLAGDYKDANQKLTIWGKTFLALTVISLVGGLSAQIADDQATSQRREVQQTQTYELLKRTQQGVVELSRIMQPLDVSTVAITLQTPCVTYRSYCNQNRRYVNVPWQASGNPAGPLQTASSDELISEHVSIMFFRNQSGLDAFANETGPGWAAEERDYSLELPLHNKPQADPYVGTSSVIPANLKVTSNQDGTLMLDAFVVLSRVELGQSRNSSTLMSTLDLPGSIVAISTGRDNLKPYSICLTTSRGQHISMEKFTSVTSRQGRIYTFEFPADTKSRDWSDIGFC